MIDKGRYIGSELELFEKASHWKSYYRSFLKPYLRGDVLEVGAGIGGTTLSLCDGSQKSWLCLEPDERLCSVIRKKIDSHLLPPICKAEPVYSSALKEDQLFDAILYMDVIEHIEREDQELLLTAKHLRPGGALIILVPAHPFLYSAFDKKIGHFRRYTKKMLISRIPASLQNAQLRYLDSVGLSASIANRLFLKSEMPSPGQIHFWDSYLVPASRIFDRLTGFTLGKSVLGVWLRNSTEHTL